MKQRSSGILLPIFSLPGKYGIGTLGQEAYEFVDFLEQTGQSAWQILPLGPTGYGDSPYQSFSTYAGNPYLISLTKLIEEGLLTQEECEACDFGADETRIDYELLYRHRLSLLELAWQRASQKPDDGLRQYLEANREWLPDYALFIAVKHHFGDVGLEQWDEDIRLRRPQAYVRYRRRLADQVAFHSYLQYLFERQWLALKEYANARGIRIIGDIPIYVSYDSADVWSEPQLFELNTNGLPNRIAGCPPDAFAPKGQRWGNPLYRWEEHKRDGYRWWIRRMRRCMQLYDVIRIDHFRGFDQYFAIEAEAETAEHGCWLDGPGMELFAAMHDSLGEIDIIAEDLGFITDSVRELVRATGYPNMKVIQFAFDARDTGQAGDHLPHTYGWRSVVYTGTHDNPPLMAWLEEITPQERKQVQTYTQAVSDTTEDLLDGLFRIVVSSPAKLCIIPLQDYLRLGSEARMNRPSVMGGNWQWRVTADALAGCRETVRQWTEQGNRLRI
ncbi:MAG: 4-alpha-glucanotransferase [Lachnospiraceae bacterium]|nr:4-alpha-glucanotransferase [Lachnospiraceae bacterium]MDY5741968.1 4-alpha-glucanotransferase [Lachnospiraceae bacterium]